MDKLMDTRVAVIEHELHEIKETVERIERKMDILVPDVEVLKYKAGVIGLLSGAIPVGVAIALKLI
jgi:hypothetical protein